MVELLGIQASPGRPGIQRVLLVHGMGRTPLSMLLLARRLERVGVATELFGYLAASQSFNSIAARLATRLVRLGATPYAVIGHSLGGLLLRAAIGLLPPDARPPSHVLMLGTPNHPARLARRFHRRLWYRAITGDAGQLLADPERMGALPPLHVPATVVAGTRGSTRRRGRFSGEANDGIVSLSEVTLAGSEMVTLPVWHTFMMNTKAVQQLVLQRLEVSDQQ